ncbi:BTB domain and ankyrin repeat protein [Histoplasma capsulatum G186AR]|uniref:BTB domain and ankyrin repeat protein n=1 Tax=Ajellomyces capsulatus TaxID=5037 RepID=A0A8H8D555_AJECA|nr:BTB domain and ankyrin repeat protein [Histoplasma capsulatum]QSS67217.1 BTB domain and ankyrin repeat protein [Histoplasma capsulatum G186AR]
MHACNPGRGIFPNSSGQSLRIFFLFFLFSPRSTYLALMVMFGLIELPAGQSLCFATADHNSTQRGRQNMMDNNRTILDTASMPTGGSSLRLLVISPGYHCLFFRGSSLAFFRAQRCLIARPRGNCCLVYEASSRDGHERRRRIEMLLCSSCAVVALGFCCHPRVFDRWTRTVSLIEHLLGRDKYADSLSCVFCDLGIIRSAMSRSLLLPDWNETARACRSLVEIHEAEDSNKWNSGWTSYEDIIPVVVYYGIASYEGGKKKKRRKKKKKEKRRWIRRQLPVLERWNVRILTQILNIKRIFN